MTSPLCYSREALRQARAQREVQPATSTICDQVPIDAPMAEGLLIGFWADWLGEFVSWDKYITTCPIDRLIDTEAQARAERDAQTPQQPEPRRGRRAKQRPTGPLLTNFAA